MSGLDHLKGKIENAFISGEPGTTGREPFEDSTSSGPAQRFASGQGLTGAGQSGNIGLGGHSHSHGTGTGTSTGAPSAGYGDNLSGTGLGQSGTTGIGSGVGSHHSHHDKDVGLGGGHLTGAAGGPATTVGSGVGHRDHGDRVGAMGQDSQDFEGRNHGGPLTSGAAGTDRFDSDRTHGSSTGTGAVGSDRQYADGVQHDTSQKAPGKSSGGLAGVFTTSDKDFTGRDRLGKGAYADTDGKFEMNKTGPAGNTALTGREGNVENNPVAQAKSRDTAGVGHGDASDINHPSHPEHPEHKSFLQKVKDAIL